MDLSGIDHVALSVVDVERSANWYVEVLGFERRYEGMWDRIPVFIGIGATAIALFPVQAKATKSSPNATGPQMQHLAFGTNSKGFQRAQMELKQRGIPFHFQDHEISHSIYFQDPDGHKLEITTYELSPA
jgi:catechol 2,3-dioxygenase-like lactoylglutathione lyase family enzyme